MSSYSYYVCLLQVFQLLQKIGVCISHSSTIRLVEHLGKNVDAHVKEWKENVVRALQVLLVMCSYSTIMASELDQHNYKL